MSPVEEMWERMEHATQRLSVVRKAGPQLDLVLRDTESVVSVRLRSIMSRKPKSTSYFIGLK